MAERVAVERLLALCDEYDRLGIAVPVYRIRANLTLAAEDAQRPSLLARLLDRLLGRRCPLCLERHRHLAAHQHHDHSGDVELTQHQEMGR